MVFTLFLQFFIAIKLKLYLYLVKINRSIKECINSIIESHSIFLCWDGRACCHNFNGWAAFLVRFWNYEVKIQMFVCSWQMFCCRNYSLQRYLGNKSIYLCAQYTVCVSKIFVAIRFIDAYGTKNPYQNSMSLCCRINWKLINILGREINSKVLSNHWQPNTRKNIWG